MATIVAPAQVDITLVRGDSDDIIVTVKDTAQPTQNLINLGIATDATPSRPAVLRYSAKEKPDRTSNARAAVFKTSYRSDEIEMLPQSGLTVGQSIIKIDKPDTSDNKAGTYAHDFEVVRQDVQRPGTGAGLGTVAVVVLSNVITGTATFFTKAKPGDVLQIISGSNNGIAVVLTKITSDTVAESEHIWLTTQSGASFDLRRGKAKTAFIGSLILTQDVVY